MRDTQGEHEDRTAQKTYERGIQMAMTGFICHDDYLNKTAKLSDEELGRLFRACMTYHATGEAQVLDGRESIAFDFIKEDIDKAEEAYKNKCEVNKKNRMQAIERASTNVDERKQMTTEEKPKQTKFVPPTADQVREYCKERGNRVDAQRFVDFYASKGWKVGNQPMKDWKAAVRTWEQKERPAGTPKVVVAQQYQQRSYNNAEESPDEMMERLGG